MSSTERLMWRVAACVLCCLFCDWAATQAIAQTNISGEVHTKNGGYPPGAKVYINKNGSQACDACSIPVKRDRTYRLETSLPPGTYTITAYSADYSPKSQTKPLKRGSNDHIDFELESPSARVTVGGLATDANGAVLASSTITMSDIDCVACVVGTAQTDDEGHFGLANIPPGHYRAEIRVGKFAVWTTTLEVTDKAQQTIALAFQPSSVQETVSVTSAATDATAIDTSLQINQLPLASGQFLTQTLLSPGIIPAQTSSSAINGQRSSSVNIILDGVSASDNMEKSYQPPVSPSSIGEFRFSQTGAVPQDRFQSVDITKSPGSQIDVSTRSGSNSFHGNVDYALMHDRLAARDFFNLPDFNTFHRHDFFANLSGPIPKFKVYFFINFELGRTATAPPFSTLLSSQIGALNQELRQLGLAPENLRRFVTNTAADSPLTRIDYNGQYDQLWAIYSFREAKISDELTPAVTGITSAPSTARDISNRQELFSVHYRHSSNLSTETIYRFQSTAATSQPIEPNEPSILIPGFAQVGRSTSLVYGDGHRYVGHILSQDFNWVSGKHGINAGGQFDFRQHRFDFAAFNSGRAISPSLAVFSENVPAVDLFQLGRGGAEVNFNWKDIIGYFQDNIRVTSTFTVNLGLRYKAELPPSPAHKETNGWQPKLSFAWSDRNGHTVFRAGYTLFRSPLPTLPLAFQKLMGGEGIQPTLPPRFVVSVVGQPAASNAFNQFLMTRTMPAGPQMAVTVDPKMKSPVVHAVDVDVTRNLSRLISIDISYALRVGKHLLTSTNTNLPSPTLINGRLDFQNAALNPAFAQIYQFKTSGNSSYQSLGLSLYRHFSSRLGFNVTYTLSKAFDDVPSLFRADVVPLESFEATPENVFAPQNERAVSGWNPTHKLTSWAIWQVPGVGNKKASSFRRALATLYFSEGLLVESGRHFNVIVGSDVNHDGNPFTDRPLTVNRNTFLGQSRLQLDISAGTNIPLSEKHRLKVSVQAFNVLNRTNFATYNLVLGQSDLSGLDPGIVYGAARLKQFDFRYPLTLSGFGMATSAFEPRRIQIEVRYQF